MILNLFTTVDYTVTRVTVPPLIPIIDPLGDKPNFNLRHTNPNVAVHLKGLGGTDVLYGGNLSDSLEGGEGRDTLIGGAGDDTLDGGGQKDQMYGGTGNDVYYVRHPEDLVIEYSNQGYDKVYAFTDFSIKGSSIEEVELVGTALSLTGGNKAELLIGNKSDNVITGLWGKDTLIGGEGNDTLVGGGDNDTLTGNSGNDTFVLERFIHDRPIYRGIDTVTDFISGEDKIQFNPRVPVSFTVVSNDTQASIVPETLVYSSQSGTLFYNPNGSTTGFNLLTGNSNNRFLEWGGAIAQLSSVPVVTDFVFVN
jgi:Ca2+-binding RTX toxin-like protein